MNILITSSARKVWLVKAFQAAGAHVIACDMDELSPALYVANEKLIQPRGVDEIGFIASYCLDHKTDAIIPTRDAELIPFAENVNMFERLGTRVIVSSKEALLNSSKSMLGQHGLWGFATPWCLWETKEFALNVIAKPINGSGSKGIFKIEIPPNYLVQGLSDSPEYTIDVFIHPNGEPISAIPRSRDVVIEGESWTSKTIKNEILINSAISFCKHLKLTWHVTMQCFFDVKTPYWTDINCRMGGASCLSFAAGANSPKWIVDILRGIEVKPIIGEFKELTMMKYTEEVYI